MNFGDALAHLKRGGRVTRGGWNGKGQYLTLQEPDEHSKMTLPYIFISTVQGDKVPWLASQTDMLAEDWQLDWLTGWFKATEELYLAYMAGWLGL